MKPNMSGSSAGCNPMLGLGLASSLPISRPMATAYPTMPYRALMPWLAYVFTSTSVSHCLVNTNITTRCSMPRRVAPWEEQWDSKAIIRLIMWLEDSRSTSSSCSRRRRLGSLIKRAERSTLSNQRLLKAYLSSLPNSALPFSRAKKDVGRAGSIRILVS